MSRIIEETDLLYRHKYAWDRPADDPDGKLDRDNGNDMLEFVNDILESNPPWGSPQARQIEVMIKVYLPQDIESKDAIQRWIFANRDDLLEDVDAIIMDMDDRVRDRW